LQITSCAAKHVPSTLQPAASGNPQTCPFGHSTSNVHGPPPASVGHDPTSHEHDPLAFVSHLTLGLPPPGQAATGGGGPQSHPASAPASGAAAQIPHAGHPLASVCGRTPYMQSGRLQTGAGGQVSTAASAVDPPSVGHGTGLPSSGTTPPSPAANGPPSQPPPSAPISRGTHSTKGIAHAVRAGNREDVNGNLRTRSRTEARGVPRSRTANLHFAVCHGAPTARRLSGSEP
jgi:hypothetical protein